MISLHPTDLDVLSPNALYAAAVARRFAARRVLAGTKAALSPAVLLPAVLLLFGCYALLAVTGVGPASWQARLCSAGGPRPAACASLPPGRAGPPALDRTDLEPSS